MPRRSPKRIPLAEPLLDPIARLRSRFVAAETALAMAPIGLGFVDRELRYVQVNHFLAQLNGLPAEEHAGKTVWEVIPSLADELVRIIRRVIDTGQPFIGLELAGKRPASSEGRRWWLATIYPLKDDENWILGVGLVLMDITARRVAERERERLLLELAAERAKLKVIIESAPEAVVVVDERGGLRLTNPAVEDLMGTSDPLAAMEALNATLRFVNTDGSQVGREALPVIRAAKEAISIQHRELTVVRADGERRHLLANAAPIREPNGRVAGAVGLFQDITARKQAAEERRKLLEQVQAYAQEVEEVNQRLQHQTLELLTQKEELERLTQELERERQQLRAVLEQSPTGVVIAEAPSGRLTLGKEHVDRLYRSSVLPPDQVEDYTVFQAMRFNGVPYRPEDMPLARAVQHGEVVRGEEMDIPRGDGSLASVSVSSSPIRDREGKVIAAVATWHDITERRQVERLLKRQAMIINQVHDAVIVTDLKGIVLTWNLGAQRLFGYTSEEAVGQSVGLIFSPEDREHLGQLIAQPVMAEGQLTREIRLHRRNGDTFFAHLALSLVLNADGKPDSVVGYGMDISDRRRAELRLRLLSEASLILGSSMDTETNLRRLTQLMAESLVDWCFAAVPGMDGNLRLVALKHREPKVQAAGEALFARALSDFPDSLYDVYFSGRPMLSDEARGPEVLEWAKSHLEEQIALAMHKLRALVVSMQARGRSFGIIGFVRPAEDHPPFTDEELAFADELGRRAGVALDNARLLEEANEANAAKDRFLAILSHELRTPLTPILAGVELLQRHVGKDGRAAKTLEIIQRSARLQARLVNDLLDLSRVSRGKIQLQKEAVQLDEVVRAAVTSLQAEIDGAGLSLSLYVRTGVWVMGDADRLQQVVMNLVGNAVKFTPAGGRLRVSLDSAGGLARILVEDNGQGMEAAMLASAFEMFHQGQQSGGKRKPGLGIGLALVRSITLMHGGRAWAESEGPGHGSRFTVELPAISPPEPAPRERDSNLGSQGLKVLLVEDNPDTRGLYQEGLASLGYQVRAVSSGAEALEIVPGWLPEVFLCDLDLPDMDGCELLKRLRRVPAMRGVAAFAVTGLGQPHDLLRSRDAGFLSHFVKPVEPAALHARLQAWLESRGEQAALPPHLTDPFSA